MTIRDRAAIGDTLVSCIQTLPTSFSFGNPRTIPTAYKAATAKGVKGDGSLYFTAAYFIIII